MWGPDRWRNLSAASENGLTQETERRDGPFPGAFPDDALDFPPGPPHASDTGDAFADFEDEIEGDATRIDDGHLLAEQSTSILEVPSAQPFLFVERGKDEGREFVLQAGVNGVGRGIDNDVILADVSVSRRHLRVILEGGQVTLRDLGSGNGTLLNGSKVSTAALAEGDRIELGETTLVVRLPGASVDSLEGATDESYVASVLPPPNPTPADPFALPDGPGYSPEMTPPSVPRPAPEPTAHTRPPPDAIMLPKRVVIALVAAAALIFALLGILVVVLAFAGDDEESAVVVGAPASHYDRGVSAFEGGRWDVARREFRAAVDESGSDARLERYVARTQRAAQDQASVDEALRLRSEGELDQALEAVHRVTDRESPLFGRAERLRAEIQADRLQGVVRAGRQALDSGDLEAARRQLDAAAAIDADAAMVQEFRAALAERAGPSEETPSEPPPASVDGPAGPGATASRRGRARTRAQDVMPRVIAAYHQGNFAEASRLATAGASRANGSDATSLRTLATRIQRFGGLWRQIRAANFAPRMRRQMEQAMTLDGQIARNPRYRNQIRGPLAQVHIADANRARGNPVRSCLAIQAALRVAPRLPEARRRSTACEATARTMMRNAQRAPRARQSTIYRDIQRMVPSGSAVGREARAAARRGAVDEDE